MRELEERFARHARGRAVQIHYEDRDFLFAADFHVAYDAPSDSFKVALRRGGCFEGAYRCLERWIEAHSEGLDGVRSVPPEHLDYRKDLFFWLIEKFYEQWRADLDAALADRAEWLRTARPGENVIGEITIEWRVSSLEGTRAGLDLIDREVRRGVLSPAAAAVLEAVGGRSAAISDGVGILPKDASTRSSSP